MKTITLFLTCVCIFSFNSFAEDNSLPDSQLPGATIIELDKIEDPTPVNTETVIPESKDEEITEHINDTASTKVETEVPKTSAEKTKPVTKASQKTTEDQNAVYTVQLGAFKARERAFSLYWQLSKKVSPLQVTAPMPKDKLYRVRYGSYPNIEEARAAAEKLKKKGIQCFVTTLKTLEIIPLKKGDE